MTNIYRVEYSETHGYYVRTEPALKDSYGKWIAAGLDENGEFNAIDHGEVFNHSDGWRYSEIEATDRWRDECRESAAAITLIAVELENIAQGPSPVIPQNRIMKPEMK